MALFRGGRIVATCLLAALVLLAAAAAAQDITLPRPTGPFEVAIQTAELIDHARVETEDPAQGPRKIMISVFSPSSLPVPQCRSPYMTDKTAAHYLQAFQQMFNVTVDFSRFVLPACSVDVTSGLPPQHQDIRGPYVSKEPQGFPLVLFSGGLGNSRFLYNALNSFLASNGFISVLIDHCYTSDFVQFPDGTTAVMDPNTPETAPVLEDLLPPRVDDSIFVLDQLTYNATLADLLFTFARPNNLSSVGFWGHSFGGATAAESAYQDPRFAAVLNLDGSMFGPVVEQGLSQPTVLWQSAVGQTRDDYPDWARIWPNLRGFKRNLRLLGSTHGIFSDDKLLADLYPWNATAVGFGPIDGHRSNEIISIYASDFFKFVLDDKDQGLLAGPSEDYPEVQFIP